MLSTSLFGRVPDHRGKVRDTYDLGEVLAQVATDKVSAFDVPFRNGVRRKGEALSRISEFWFERIDEWGIPHHFLAVIDSSNEVEILCRKIPPSYHGRTTLVRKAKRLDAEHIVRVALSGSGWKAYQSDQPICGISLRPGYVESDILDEPIFTPTTKGETDVPITYSQLEKLIGKSTARMCRDISSEIINRAQPIAREAGLLIADTKFEFGVRNGEVILIDEALTPDSSRIWPLDSYRPGGPQISFDKQPVRDWMLESGWKKGDPAPILPDQVAMQTTIRYLELYKRLSGKEMRT